MLKVNDELFLCLFKFHCKTSFILGYFDKLFCFLTSPDKYKNFSPLQTVKNINTKFLLITWYIILIQINYY